MKKRKIKKCMEWADKNNIDYVAVIGEQEIETNEIEIKDMKNYNSNKLNINDIDKIIELIK
jgi:histidyl-tRNA synthetase